MAKVYEDLGLTKTEYEVYLCLLKEGSCAAGVIIKKANLHRATAYDVLERLIKKGLASYTIINKKKYYRAAPPQQLVSLVTEQKKNIDIREKRIRQLAAGLSKVMGDSSQKHIAEIYEGKRGLKAFMQDILDTGRDFCCFGGEVRFDEILPAYTREWAKEREKKRIYARILLSFKAKSTWKMNKIRCLPGHYSLPSPTIIYGSKVAIILYEDPLTIILISSKAISSTYQAEFELLWKNL